jgi:hypothetical protein
MYRVLDTITASVGLPLEDFVFVTATQTFDHVAVVSDIAAYPNTYAAAVAGNYTYYRLASVQIDWATVASAEDFATTLQARLKALCVDYDAAVATFLGTTTETISS